MTDLKICRICLRTEAKMYRYERFHLKSYYEEVLALKVDDEDGLPHYFCFECATLLHKFHKFKEKCYRGQKVLKELLWFGPLSYESIYKIDRPSKELQLELVLTNNIDRINCYVIVDGKENNTNESDKEYKNDEKVIEDCHEYHDSNESLENEINEMSNKKIIYKDGKNCMSLKNETIMERKNSTSGDESNLRAQLFDVSKWKVINLSEEEAVKEFRLRVEDQKYIAATYRCSDCFRGFSKESMLKCHIQLKHSEILGSFECHFCKMRFRWQSHLKRHIRQHYIKYQCLRCDRICPLENTAIRHEEYHSGVTKECVHCGKKFRHSSTYYTHLRTHRSHFVCTICGSSFVSEVGLRQHKRVKHVYEEIESPDDDEEVNTNCDKCNMNFETRKAYEEHLFHSAMHSEVVEEREVKEESEKSAPRKVLGKKMKTMITRELKRLKSSDEATTSLESKRRRRQKRRYCKPTTCHQCGKHFATQSACKKHHHLEHPRTSFFPPTARHICEICGASLAPGSVTTHQNMHTRSKVHPCEICGRQFHATVGLKRHLLTHTGEKPFACTLCDKRFTQSNSMKLHYRTFHLKQPYPKRSRSKKGKGAEDETDSTEDDSEEEQKGEMDIARDMNITKANNLHEIENNVIVDDNMHYLTLT